MSYTINTKCSNEQGKTFIDFFNKNKKIINKILANSVNKDFKNQAINKKDKYLTEFYYENGRLSLNINGVNSEYYRAFSAIMAWVATKTETFQFEFDNIDEIVEVIIIKNLKDIENFKFENNTNNINKYFVNKDGISMKFLYGDEKLFKIFKQTNYNKMFESLNELNIKFFIFLKNAINKNINDIKLKAEEFITEKNKTESNDYPELN